MVDYVSSISIKEEAIEEVKDLYGDEMFEDSVETFCESSFDIYLRDFNAAYEAQSFTDIKSHVHKFKTTSRYLGCLDLALKCEEIEKFTKDQDWTSIEKVWGTFLIDYKQLHLEVVKLFLKMFPDKDLFNESFMEAKAQVIQTSDIKKAVVEDKKEQNIQIDSKTASVNYGEQIFKNNLNGFIENYPKTKAGLENAYKTKNQGELKMLTTTLKTTVRYMCSEYFALELQTIENNAITDGWGKVEEVWETLMKDYELLHQEALKVKQEYDDVVKSERESSNRSISDVKNLTPEVDKNKISSVSISSGEKLDLYKDILLFERDCIKIKSNLNRRNLEQIDNIKNELDRIKENLKGVIVDGDVVVSKLYQAIVDLKKVTSDYVNEQLTTRFQGLETVFNPYGSKKDFKNIITQSQINDFSNFITNLKEEFQDYTTCKKPAILSVVEIERFPNISNSPKPNPTSSSYSQDKAKGYVSPSYKPPPVREYSRNQIRVEVDNYYKDIKKLNFENLMKKDMTKEELQSELKKFTNAEIKAKAAPNTNSALRNRRRKENNENDYPFKEEKFECAIF